MSSTRKKSHASQSPAGHKYMAEGWSTLPDDIARKICQSFLDTNDLDCYVDFRDVCGNWRHATEEPDADGTDPKFIPNKWIMIEHSIFEDGRVTFLNLITGRFLRKNISDIIERYFFVGVTIGGLFVLGERHPPYETRVLNPFTGAMVHFKAGIPMDRVGAVAVTSSPMRVFVTTSQYDVGWIDLSSEGIPSGWTYQGQLYRALQRHGCLVSMTPFNSDVYVTDEDGSIISATDVAAAKEGTQCQQRQCSAILGPPEVHEISNLFYLVESDGDLLLVMDCMLPVYNGGPVVYKVDAVNKVLVPVSSIGSHALFVSQHRCLSIDCKIFHTIEAGSIYYADHAMIRAYDSETVTGGGWEADAEYVIEFGRNLEDCARPFTLAQLLVDYCGTIEYSEIEMLPPHKDIAWSEWSMDYTEEEA